MGVVVQCSIGGKSVGKDIEAYKKGVHGVVGTPGRVLDLIRYSLYHLFIVLSFYLPLFRRGNLNIDALRVLVLDEADEVYLLKIIIIITSGY